MVSFYSGSVGSVVKDDFCKDIILYARCIIVDCTITKKTLSTNKRLPSRNQAALNQFRTRAFLNGISKTARGIEANSLLILEENQRIFTS